MDFAQGFVVRRAARRSGGDGGFLPFPALTAIHMAHRLGALVAAAGAGLLLAWRLARAGAPPRGLGRSRSLAIAAWQAASGLGNVLLGWPLARRGRAHGRRGRRWSSC